MEGKINLFIDYQMISIPHFRSVIAGGIPVAGLAATSRSFSCRQDVSGCSASIDYSILKVCRKVLKQVVGEVLAENNPDRGILKKDSSHVCFFNSCRDKSSHFFLPEILKHCTPVNLLFLSYDVM